MINVMLVLLDVWCLLQLLWSKKQCAEGKRHLLKSSKPLPASWTFGNGRKEVIFVGSCYFWQSDTSMLWRWTPYHRPVNQTTVMLLIISTVFVAFLPPRNQEWSWTTHSKIPLLFLEFLLPKKTLLKEKDKEQNQEILEDPFKRSRTIFAQGKSGATLSLACAVLGFVFSFFLGQKF